MGNYSITFFKYLINLILVALIVSSMNSVTATANPTAKIAIVFSTGGLGDLSFNDAANKGLLDAKEANSGITSQQVEPTGVAGINSAIESFAADGSFDLIIGIGFTATDGITASAKAHPAQNFMIVDSVISLPNVVSIVFAEHEGSFLAGAMAAMVSETNDISFLGGLDIPLINKFFAGYYEGARYINPGVIVRKTYSPNPSNPWGDLTGGKSVAFDLIEEGSDVIYAAAGGTGIGVMDAVEEASSADNKIYAIGVDSNQDHLKPGFVLTSMIKRVDVAVSTQIQAVVDGTWTSGFTELDLAADGVGITDMQYTQEEANEEFQVGVTRMEKVDELTTMIKNGAIIVKDLISEYTEIPPEYNVTTSSVVDEPTLDFLNYPVLLLSVSFLVMFVIIRKKIYFNVI